MKNPILILACFLISSTTFSQTDSIKPIIFITDASGSMWQKIGPDFKITLAREVLGALVSEMPDHQAVGLVAYGHREKSDCDDIEEILPPGNTDKAAFQNALKELNPLGKTPLAKSVQQVIEKLKNQNNSATVILITDGIETCEGDLCAVVREAKATGVDFVMHIVGFDLGDSDKEALQCAAGAGDGLYIDASDKDELSAALEQTSELTVDIPTGRLSVECKRNGELIDGTVVIYKAGTDEDIAGQRTYTSPQTNPALLSIPSGSYDVEVTLVGQRGIAPIRKYKVVVTDTATNQQVFDFSSGYLEFTVTDDGQLHDATVNVRLHGDNKSITAGRTYESAGRNPLKKELTPGMYDIDIGSVKIKGPGSKRTIENVEIKAGETTSLMHAFESAVLSAGATYNGELCDATVNIVSLNPREAVAGGRTYESSTSNPKTFLISPGEYEVELRTVKIKPQLREKFTLILKPGEKVEKIIDFK